jgi:hypothetical protein
MQQDMEDKGGGPWYSKYDRVRLETIWKQTVKKETDNYHQVKTFQMNLVRPGVAIDRIKYSHNRIELITEKEHHQSPQQRMNFNAEAMPPDTYEVQMIKHLTVMPQGKWDLPQSTAQEVGWFAGLTKPRTSAQIRGKKLPPLNGVIPCMTGANEYTPRDYLASNTKDQELARRLRTLNSPRWNRPKQGTDITNLEKKPLA